MVNKKGFIRTLEAVIAIILILGFIFWVTPKVTEFEEEVPENIASSKEFIMNQILYDKDYSQCIAFATEGKCEDVLISVSDECKSKIIDSLIKKNIPVGYDYSCEICSGSWCGKANYPDDRSIYTNSIFVYRSDKNYNTIRIFIWKK